MQFLQRLLAEVRALLGIGAPLIAAQLAQMGMGFIDTVMMGRVGAVELAGVAIGAGLWHTLFLFGLGILMALSPSVAQLYGGGRCREIAPLVQQALWLSLLLGALGFFGLREVGSLLDWFGIAAPIQQVITEYLSALAWGMWLIFPAMSLRLFSEGIARTAPVLLVSLSALAVNALANYALIFGHWGFPALGAAGCGFATALSMGVLLIGMIVVLRVDPHYRVFAIGWRWELPRWFALRSLLVIGLPIGVGLFLETAVFAAVALLLGSLGSVAAAAHQIALNVAGLSFMIPLGLSMATTVRVGQALGRGDSAAVRFSGWVGISLGGLFMSIMAVLIFSGCQRIAGFYTDDVVVAQVAAQLLQLAALFQISDGLQVGALGALRGLQDTRIPMWIVLVAYWVIAFPLAWQLGIAQGLGATGPWIGLIAGLTVAAVLLNTRFWRLSHRLRGCNPGRQDTVAAPLECG